MSNDADNFLKDYESIEAFARRLDKSYWTVRRWIHEHGLPHVWLGSKIIIHVPTAREYILSGKCAVTDRAERIAAERRERAERREPATA